MVVGLVGAAAILATVSSACSSDSQTSLSGDAVPVSPLEIAVARYYEVGEAEEFVETCMAGEGFDYSIPEERLIRLKAGAPNLPPDGVYSEEWVTENGYGLAVSMLREIRDEIGSSDSLPRPKIEESENLKYYNSLSSDQQLEYEEKRSECRGGAEEFVVGLRPYGAESASDTYNRIVSSAEYLDAEDSWKRCMKGAGFEFDGLDEPYLSIQSRLSEAMSETFGFDDEGAPSVKGSEFLDLLGELAEEEALIARADYGCEPSTFSLSSELFDVS